MESGSVYGNADVHAEGAIDGRLISANNECAAIRRHLWAPTLALNVIRLAQDLGSPPAEIMTALPDYHCRIMRGDTPEARQQVFSKAMLDGLPVSREQYRGELHIDEPKDEDDVLKGQAQSIPSAGEVVGAVEASEGKEAPPQPEKTQSPRPAPPAQETA
jgi:hypothetical protein